jgi:hypothetical protein
MVPSTAARPSTSVMDYLTNNDSVPMFTPGDYDADAIKYLYGLASAEPKQTFCTDNGVSQDPNCAVFDRGDDPLNKYHGKYYTAYLNAFYKTQNIFYLLYWDYWLNNVLGYVRAGQDDATQNAALGIALQSVVAPTATANQNAQMGPLIDLVGQWIFARMYIDTPDMRGDISFDPGRAVEPTAVAQLKAYLTNVDGIRSYPTRRLAVDILKKQQDMAGYDALVTSRAAIVTARAAMQPGADAELTDDLLARIDVAIHPYFN